MKINKNKFVKTLRVIKDKYHMSLAKIGRQCKIPVSSIYKLTSPHSNSKAIISSSIANKIARGLGFNNSKTKSWLSKISIKKPQNKNKVKHQQNIIKDPHILKYGIHDMMSRKGISKRMLQKRANIKASYLNHVLSGDIKEISNVDAKLISKALNTNIIILIKRSKEISKNNHNATRLQPIKKSNDKPHKSPKPQIHVSPYIFSIAEKLSNSNDKVIGTAENVINHLSNDKYQEVISDLINLNHHDFSIIAPLIIRIYNSEHHN